MLQIYNTLTNRKETFIPMTPGEIKMYVCGMTVYDYCHLGHARVLITFDMVARYLREMGYRLTFVCNITDIDDKIIQRAAECGKSVTELTNYFIQALHSDCQRLQVLPPDIQPRATHYIAHIIALIQRLIANKSAYQARNGDVYFDVSQFPEYGKLSNQDLSKLRSGARVDIVDAKSDPLDFVLWKMSKPGEPQWDSPWGAGRPGWHIECSAMAMDCLGEQFDIHGGGPDLPFPHHENEIAQSEAATKRRFVNTWMHVGALTIDDAKMSKSLGNILSIRETCKDYPAEVIRYFLLSSHYRSPLNYAKENLDNAYLAVRRFYIACRDLPDVQVTDDLLAANRYVSTFHQAMQDDFNTPVALAVLFDMAHQINKMRDSEPQQAANVAAILKHLARPLGILQSRSETFLQADVDPTEIAQITALIAERERARENKNWARADEIRQQLADLSVELEDAADGTRWRKRS